MTFKRFILNFVTIIFILGLIEPALVKAQESSPFSNEIIWKLVELTGDDTLRMEGYRPSTKLNFIIPTGWEPSSDGILSLDYRLSELVTDDAVLITRINEITQVSSPLIDDAGTFEIAISENFLQPGVNTLELNAFLPLDDDQSCIVPNHPARWLEFYSTSQIGVPIKMGASELILSDFPDQYESKGSEVDEKITFVVPDDPNLEVLNSLSSTAFALQRELATNSQWTILPSTEFSAGSHVGPAIFIGPMDFNTYVEHIQPPESTSNGWLSVSRPDWSNGNAVLVVSGPNSNAVLQAAYALVDPMAKFQMSGSSAVIESLPSVQPTMPIEQFTFGDIGYSERIVSGGGEQSLIYSFDLPTDWSMNDGLLELHFAHSAAANPQFATLKVIVNGNTATDILLDAPESSSNYVEVFLPKNHLRPGRNFLRLAFDFGLPVEICDSAITKGPWASIRSDTKLTLAHTDNGNRIELGDFPYLFNSEVDLENLEIVLPSQSNFTDYRQVLEIVRSLSLANNRSPFVPEWVSPAEFDEEGKNSHLIVLGDMGNQPLLKELNPHLPIPFNFEDGTLAPTYGIRLPIKKANLGVIQIIRSPWKQNRVIIIVSGTNFVGYESAIKYLTDPESQKELDGQVAIISQASPETTPQILTQTIPDLGSVPVIGVIDSFINDLIGSNSPFQSLHSYYLARIKNIPFFIGLNIYLSYLFGTNNLGKAILLILFGLLFVIFLVLIWRRVRKTPSSDSH